MDDRGCQVNARYLLALSYALLGGTALGAAFGPVATGLHYNISAGVAYVLLGLTCYILSEVWS